MTSERVAALVGAACVATVYLARAATGIHAGTGYPAAARLAAKADYAPALARLEGGGAGFDRFETLWLRGQVRLGLWDRLAADKGAAEADPRMLRLAAADFASALGSCPPSAWPLTGLADVYQRLARGARLRGPIDMEILDEEPWRRLDRREAVALGLARMATDREPMVFRHWDAVANLCLRLDLRDAAKEALERSAAVQPAPVFHTDLDFDAMPRDLAIAFADASRAAIGKAPMLSPERHRLFLGQLELRLGRLDRAESDFRAALDLPGDALNKAEDRYWLGLVLAAKGDTSGAVRALTESGAHPVFRVAALTERARLLEKDGTLAEALDLWDELRRLEPRNAAHAARFAAIAMRLGKFDRAEEALRWAVLIAPQDPAPRVALVEALTAAGKNGAAESAFDALASAFPTEPDLDRLRALLAKPRDPKENTP